MGLNKIIYYYTTKKNIRHRDAIYIYIIRRRMTVNGEREVTINDERIGVCIHEHANDDDMVIYICNDFDVLDSRKFRINTIYSSFE